jgi:hypothetical protein
MMSRFTKQPLLCLSALLSFPPPFFPYRTYVLLVLGELESGLLVGLSLSIHSHAARDGHAPRRAWCIALSRTVQKRRPYAAGPDGFSSSF